MTSSTLAEDLKKSLAEHAKKILAEDVKKSLVEGVKISSTTLAEDGKKSSWAEDAKKNSCAEDAKKSSSSTLSEDVKENECMGLRTVCTTGCGQVVEFVCLQGRDYVELQVAKGPGNFRAPLKVFMVDVKVPALPIILEAGRQLAKKALDQNDEVLFILFGSETSCHLFRTAEKLDEVIDAWVKHPNVAEYDRHKNVADLSWSSAYSYAPFATDAWQMHSCPRLAFERLQSCLTHYHDERHCYPESMQILFATGGGTPPTPHDRVDESFVRDSKQFYTNCRQCPTLLVYLEVDPHSPESPEAHCILSIFPVNRCISAERGNGWFDSVSNALFQTHLYQRFPVKLNFENQVTHLLLNEYGQCELNGVKKLVLFDQIQVQTPDTKLHKLQPAAILRYKITQFMAKKSSRNTDEWEELWREACQLSTWTAEQQRARDMLLWMWQSQYPCYDRRVARRIQHAAKVAPNWKHHTSIDKEFGLVTNTIEHKNSSNETCIYRCSVPKVVLEDHEQREVLTSNLWETIFRMGDTRCQCFLWKSPKFTDVVPADLQVALVPFTHQIERHNARNVENIVACPLKAPTSDQYYNVALPIWSPNCKFNIMYRLKPLLALTLAKHPLAFHPRFTDIYVPAIVAMWKYYFNTRKPQTLQDTLLLMKAYHCIQQWIPLSAPSPHKHPILPLLHVFSTTTTTTTTVTDKKISAIDGKSHTAVAADGKKNAVAAVAAVAAAGPSAVAAVAAAGPTAVAAVVAAGPSAVVADEKSACGPDEGRCREVWKEVLKRYIFEWVWVANARDEGIIVRKYLRPVIKCVIAHERYRGAQDVAVRDLVNSEESIDKILSPFMDGATVEFVSFLTQVAFNLPPDIWTILERDYRLPSPFEISCKRLLPLSLTNYEILEWMAEAQQRQQPCKPVDLGGQIIQIDFDNVIGPPITDKAFVTLIHKVVAANVATSQKVSVHDQKFAAQRVSGSHGGLPLMMAPADMNRIHEWSKKANTCDEFCKLFYEYFKMQMDASKAVFLENKAGNESDYRNTVSIALHRLWVCQKSCDAPMAIVLRSTSLPNHRCAFVNCPDFLVPQNDLCKHLADKGIDLPLQDPSRYFLKFMHSKIKTIFNLQPQIDKPSFVQYMNAYASPLLHPNILPHFSTIFNHIFTISKSFYAN